MAMSLQKRELVAQKRRTQILEAALKLFIEKGYDEATIQEVAEAADISKGLIYQHFGSKTDILDAFEELLDLCRSEVLGMPTATESLRLYATRLLLDTSVTGYRPALRLYIMCYIKGGLNERLREKYFDKTVEILFAPLVRKGQEAGEFRAGDPLKMGSLFWHCLLGYTADLLGDRRKRIDANDIDFIFEQILN